jgi:hypothetical protein
MWYIWTEYFCLSTSFYQTSFKCQLLLPLQSNVTKFSPKYFPEPSHAACTSLGTDKVSHTYLNCKFWQTEQRKMPACPIINKFYHNGLFTQSRQSIKISQLLLKITVTFAHENLKSFRSTSLNSPTYTDCFSVLNHCQQGMACATQHSIPTC